MTVNNHKRRKKPANGAKAVEWPEKLKLSEARIFLGVSSGKMTNLINNGVIEYEQSPLDHRIKLVRRADLEQLKRQLTSV